MQQPINGGAAHRPAAGVAELTQHFSKTLDLNAALENTSSELSTLRRHREAEQPCSSGGGGGGGVQGDVHATLAALKEMSQKH